MSRHKCTKELYKSFLQATSMRYSGLSLSEVSPINLSHDSVSRWLSSQKFRPREVFEIANDFIDKEEPCLLIADDSVLSKQRSKNIDLVQYQYSGNEHDVIAGIGLVNLLWHGLATNESVPVDFRVYNKESDGKTKNTHFCEMLKLAKTRGITPDAVVMDSWYSSLNNLKCIRDLGWVWVTNLKKNRKVNRGEILSELEIPEEGLQIHLRGYGWVHVFKFEAKNGRIDYVTTNMENATREKVYKIVKSRWSIEVYHREIKQTCGIERCQARTGRAQRNHILLSIMAWFALYRQRRNTGETFYKQTWQVIKTSIREKIDFLMGYAYS